MSVQTSKPDHPPESIVERVTASARRLSARIGDIADRGQLGPTRQLEARDFRPSRRT